MGFPRLLRFSALGIVAVAAAVVVGGILLGEVAAHPMRLGGSITSLRQDLSAGVALAREEDVQISSGDGVVLRGTYAVPEMSNGNSVILLHGISDNRMGVSGFARLFLAGGYRVLLVDSRAQGASGGDFATYGVLERADVHRWLDWLEEHQASACIYGFGESMGAAILLQSLQNESRFCAVVSESPFATFREAALERIGRITRTGGLAPYIAWPSSEVAYRYFQWRYGPDLNTANPIAVAAQSCTPILLIHGQADQNILPSNSEEILRASHGNVQLWRVPQARHCGAWATDPEGFQTRVLGWFASHQHLPGYCG